MAIKVEEFEALQKKIEALKSRKDRAEGACESIIETWKSQYGVSTLDEAQALLDRYRAEMSENDILLEEWMATLRTLVGD